MIVDKIENAGKYYKLGKNFELGLKFLKENDLSLYSDGRYELDGENVFVNIQSVDTRNQCDGMWESHKKYTDIQFLIDGEETLGFSSKERCKTIIEYDIQNDIAFFEGDGNFVHIKSGEFVIFMPWDLHMPLITTNGIKNVKKAIVKLL